MRRGWEKECKDNHLFTISILLHTHTHTHTLPPHSDDREYLLHVVSGVLSDDGHYLPQLFKHVLPHVIVTVADGMEEGRHHLEWDMMSLDYIMMM